jgi:hypothetical protein
MGTYENFYLNQIKQLQEENKKLKQIIDEGVERLVGRDRTLKALNKKDSRARQVPATYASDDMESRRTQPGYGPSSDSPTPGPSGRLTNQRWNAGRFPNG